MVHIARLTFVVFFAPFIASAGCLTPLDCARKKESPKPVVVALPKPVVVAPPKPVVVALPKPVVVKIAPAAIEEAKKRDKAIEKALQDTKAEIDRAGVNINDAAIAAGHFVENQIQGWGKTLSDADKRIREGKLMDAIWHTATDPLRHADDNLGRAVIESSLLNNMAIAVSSIYGGPKGAAAYNAWYAYKQTGDLGLALKAGVIAGATDKGLKLVNGMPSATTDQLTKKALASASIGGAAVAASGGGEKEVIEAFFKGAALTYAREHYKDVTNKEIEGKAPTKSAVTKIDSDGNPILTDSAGKHQYSILVDEKGTPIRSADGHYQIDITTMPRNISHVGIATDNPNASFFSGAETSKFMQLVAKIPYLNDMAYYHDQWAAIAQMEGIEVKTTIFPATILTVTGSDTPIINQATNENIEQKKKPNE